MARLVCTALFLSALSLGGASAPGRACACSCSCLGALLCSIWHTKAVSRAAPAMRIPTQNQYTSGLCSSGTYCHWSLGHGGGGGGPRCEAGSHWCSAAPSASAAGFWLHFGAGWDSGRVKITESHQSNRGWVAGALGARPYTPAGLQRTAAAVAGRSDSSHLHLCAGHLPPPLSLVGRQLKQEPSPDPPPDSSPPSPDPPAPSPSPPPLCKVGGDCTSGCTCPQATPLCDGGKCKVGMLAWHGSLDCN